MSEMADLLPGPELMALLAGLAPVPRTDPLDLSDQVTVAQAWQRIGAYVDAQLNTTMLHIAGTFTENEEQWGREEIAAGLRMSCQAVNDRLEVAEVLASLRGAATRRALEAGEITYRHAAEIVHALKTLDDEKAALVEADLLGLARKKTPAQLKGLAKKLVAKADPEGADTRHRKAKKGSRVEFYPMDDGMAEVHAIMAADKATQLRTHLDHISGRGPTPGDPRTLDHRRADDLVALVDVGALTTQGVLDPYNEDTRERTEQLVRNTLTGKRATPARIAVTVPLSTLIGTSNHPGHLTGYGPIPATIARELAADGHWEKWITDLRGVVTDLGRSTYKPSAALADLVRAQHPTCVFPTCSMPSYRCDLDHNIRRIDGGTTSLGNLLPVCRRHHRLKDEGGWELVHDPVTGSCTWTSPAGLAYTVDPPDQSDGYTEDWTIPLTRPEPATVAAAPIDNEPPPF